MFETGHSDLNFITAGQKNCMGIPLGIPEKH